MSVALNLKDKINPLVESGATPAPGNADFKAVLTSNQLHEPMRQLGNWQSKIGNV